MWNYNYFWDDLLMHSARDGLSRTTKICELL